MCEPVRAYMNEAERLRHRPMNLAIGSSISFGFFLSLYVGTDAERAHAAVNRRAVDSQASCGGGGVPAAFPQDANELVSLAVWTGRGLRQIGRGTDRLVDSVTIDTLGSRENGSPLHRVLELSNVAWPRMFSQASERGHREGRSEVGKKGGEEVVRERRDVIGAGVERRNVEHDASKAVKEILAEAPFVDERQERLIGGRDRAKVADPVASGADRAKGRCLDGSQELGLRRERGTTDFVEKERASIGFGQVARVFGGSAGERAAHVSRGRPRTWSRRRRRR
jgi:hypothetical protein